VSVRVTRAVLRDFRNYERGDFRPGAGLTVVCGPNGAGKTNLVEALYFGLTGRSSRTSNEREVVRLGTGVARVSVETLGEDGAHMLEVGFAPGEPKRLWIDGSRVERLSMAAPRPPVSVFAPDRLDLVKGAPALRRAHLDQFTAAVWPARSETRAAYGRALAQRNALIARVRAGAASAELLDTWDAELARHGERLILHRRNAADLLSAPFAARASELGLPEQSVLRYRPRSRAADAAELREELRARRDDDVARGFSAHGPHRDEVELTHAGRALRAYGSQGQQRVGLLALLFAERDVLVERGTPPLMLLDDVMSELDGERRERLAELVRSGGQAIICTTEPEHVPGSSHPDVVITRVAPAGVLEPWSGEVPA
jgi:DNA replication and repair protein RecF